MNRFTDQGRRYSLQSPRFAPNASAFLWNQRMMAQITCRGFAVSQFMQPEPAKYAHVPTLAGTSFMQPEQPYFTHHPGRFFYVRDNENGTLFSAPFEPVKTDLDRFEFSPGQSDIRWTVEKDGIQVSLRFTLAPENIVEIWSVEIVNQSNSQRDISLIPYFPVGYASWMNMGGAFDEKLGGMVCSRITPYQKVEDYFKQKDFNDLTYLVSDRQPDAWEACQNAFEGDGGLNAPDALKEKRLACGDALYEIPACILQYDYKLAARESRSLNLLFGPASNREDIVAIKDKLLASHQSIEAAANSYADYIAEGAGSISIETPDETFSHFVNHWLPRQVFYHGDVNRLTTDPQTRNYLQDAMGMAFIKPEVTRAALIRALSQQRSRGEVPDGILLSEEAELKYINQIPHTDHPVWLAITLTAYLNETNDWAILDEMVAYDDDVGATPVYEHMRRGMEWLIQSRDERGLSYIAQGDWCDPMNMVGYKGKGVSGWLTEALSYALQLWIPICEQRNDSASAKRYTGLVEALNENINQHLWDGEWYGRGITDDGVVFGTRKDEEGKIFLNAQSWAFLCGAPSDEQKASMLNAINAQLKTPYGVMMLAPAFTKMRDDVGRVTQKWPGSAENGSIYNHAAAFYAASLYHLKSGDDAFDVLRRMVPGPDESDMERRGQLPIYVPNYYRGAYYQHPRTAGRSSHLFNTGTASWFYRLVIEELFGLKGSIEGLRIEPKLPSDWKTAKATRTFRGSTFEVSYQRTDDEPSLIVNGNELIGNVITEIEAGVAYKVVVKIKK